MIIKYKVSEVAKDLNKPAKQIVDHAGGGWGASPRRWAPTWTKPS